MRRRFGAGMMAFIWLVGGEAAGRRVVDARLLHRELQRQKGLPQNTVMDLLQTEDGYLWIVTPFGLSLIRWSEFQDV